MHKNDNNVSCNDSAMSEADEKKKEKDDEMYEIPPELDDHFKLFGKHPWEIEYGEKCPKCQSRIDEFGFCACDSSGD